MIGKTRYQVRLFLNEKSKEFTAMADSGNRLVEPVTGKPVSIIAAADAKEFLGEKAGVLMIPYRAVGTENGMLPGVLFDRMVRRGREYPDRASDRGDFEGTSVFREGFYDDTAGGSGGRGKCACGNRGLT